ncbi:MAG: BA14K family protein [Pseudorhodoplanes sp.]
MKTIRLLGAAALSALLAIATPAFAQQQHKGGHGAGMRSGGGGHGMVGRSGSGPPSGGNRAAMRVNPAPGPAARSVAPAGNNFAARSGNWSRSSGNWARNGNWRSGQFAHRGNWNRHRGYYRGAGYGFAAGLAAGSALSYYDSGYDPYYSDDYAYDTDTLDDYAYVDQPDDVTTDGSGSSDESDAAYCAQRYRSYDAASGTYLGYDGQRHPCP